MLTERNILEELKAQQALANQTHFKLNDEQWRAFEKILDRPEIENPEVEMPGLTRLLRDPVAIKLD